MSRIKKRAYISSAIIILMLVGLALYVQQQSKQLTVEFNELNPTFYSTANQTPKEAEMNEPASTTTETPAPTTNTSTDSPTPPPATKVTQKLKSVFIDIDDFRATVPTITVDAGYKVNLYIKTVKPLNSDGLNVTVPGQTTVLVKPGYTEEFSFTATSDLSIPVASKNDPNKALYFIEINVK